MGTPLWLFLLPAGDGRQRAADGVELEIQIVPVLKQGVVDAGPDKAVGQSLDQLRRQAQLLGKQLGILPVPDIHPTEKRLALSRYLGLA